MKTRFLEHGISLVLVGSILIALIVFFQGRESGVRARETARISEFVPESPVDWSDPFQKALFRDVLNLYFQGQEEKNGVRANEVLQAKAGLADEEKARKEPLSAGKLLEIFLLFLKFICVYAVTLALTYYGVQTLGVWRFVKRKRAAAGLLPPEWSGPKAWFKKAAGLAASFVLFSPAYVIAYSFKTEISTDSVFFLVFLSVISNGLLITYSNKFYQFLVAESRKGYVEAALAKNLSDDYSSDVATGITHRTVLRPAKRFDGHVFGQIYANARYQYFATLKEQAVFLITGLVIIEMALNLHGYFSYEMLRQLLYGNIDTALVFFFGVFATVKATEILADVVHQRETRKIENR